MGAVTVYDANGAAFLTAANPGVTKITDGTDQLVVNIDGSIAIRPVYKAPINVSATVSIAASGSGTATINVPTGKRYFIKQVNITKGADVSVTSLTFDGNETGQTANFDCVTIFGDLLTADTSIDISGSNAGAAAEDLTIQVTGYVVDK